MPFGKGHINDTFLTESPHGKFIFQKVNGEVFDINVLVSNLRILFEKLRAYSQKEGEKLMPEIFPDDKGNYHTLAPDGSAWRLWAFVENGSTYSVSPSEEISHKAAAALGSFQKFLATLPTEKFGESIKDFHNPLRRYFDFEKALATAPFYKKEKARKETAFLLSLKNIALEARQIIENPDVPLRITHNDPKLENILFDSAGRVLVIDPDTIMPGYLMFDYGDMVRSFCTSAAEDERDISKVNFRFSHLQALTRAYLSSMGDVLTPKEKLSLPIGAKAIVYEQALRFLSDYFNGDIYYKTHYEEHNLVRAANQIKLLKDILKIDFATV